MQNKTKTYLLLAAVLAIWSIVSYQIVTGLSPDTPELIQNSFDIEFRPKKNKVADTFSIQTTDRDPFLGTLTKTHTRTKLKKVAKKHTKDTTWLPISYHGLVKRQDLSQQIFAVNIDGVQHLLKKGQAINNVRLLKGNEKQIFVSYKNKQKTIPIQ